MGERVDARAGRDLLWRDDPIAKDEQDVGDLVRLVRVFSEAEISIAVELVVETLRRGRDAGYEFVFADRGGRLAGYACFGPIPATIDSHDLYWIAVHPEERGYGLGAALIARSEKRIAAQGGRRVFVDTSSRDAYASAHGLYAASGYREAARLDDFYGPGDAKLIFAKALEPGGRASAFELDP